MPGRLILVRPSAEVAAWFGWRGDGPDLTPRRNIAPGQDVLAWGAEGPAFARWGMIPVGRVNARGRPVMETIVNARSETVFDKSAYRGTGRAVVPADGGMSGLARPGARWPGRLPWPTAGLWDLLQSRTIGLRPAGASCARWRR